MATDPLALPAPRSRRPMWVALTVIALTVTAVLLYDWKKRKDFEAEWTRLGPIEPSGGKPFPGRLELPVPSFAQADERWGHEKLGNTPATLGAEGCAVSSAAMVLASYGVDTDPGRLNKLLTENDGYEGAGWIRWEKASELTGQVAVKEYEDLPSYERIDTQLQQNNPVIVRLKKPGSMTHFVVIAGKDGYDYLTRDPGPGASKGLYPLKEYGSKIEALRYYRRVKVSAP